MPIYEYECNDCDLKFEAMRSFSSADIPLKCELCKSFNTKRIISNFFSIGSSPKGDSSRSSCSSCSGGNCSTCT